MAQLTTYCKALSEPIRLRLVAVLSANELNVGELVDILGVGQSGISHHLKVLAGCGLVKSRKDGLKVFYSAADLGGPKEFLAALGPMWSAEPEIRADLQAAEQAILKRRDNTRVFFDDIASRWDALNHEVLGGLDLAELVAPLIPEVEIATDLGCGTGVLSRLLLEKSQRLIGVDNSPKMLEEARQRLAIDNGRVSLRLGALEHLPLGNGEADLALASLALHHLPRPSQGLAEAGRVLKIGGMLVIVEFVNHKAENMRTRFGDHWLGFEPAKLDSWLRDSGFVNINRNIKELPGGLALQLITAVKA